MWLGKTEEPKLRRPESERDGRAANKKISKKIGEYIDYEEVNKKDR